MGMLSTEPLGRRLSIEYLPLDRLAPDPDNTRIHSKTQIAQIAKSIKAFGFSVPILIDAADKVLCGHGRLEACRRVGMTEAPVVRLDDLSESQAKAFQIAENRLTELGGWDEIKLAQTLRDLSLQDLTFDLDTIGFEMGEIDLRIEGLQLTPAAADPVDDPVPGGPSITRVGDLWRLGRHKVLCGDALAAGSYDLLMGSTLADVVITDPPYNVPIQGHVGGRGRTKHREFAMAVGEMSEAAFTDFLATVMGHAVKRSRPGALGYWFMDWRHLYELIGAGKASYGEMKNLCVWAKTHAGQGALYRSQHELVAVFKRPGGAHTNNVQLGRFGRNRSNLWTYSSPSSFGRAGEEGSLLADHPTPKPVAMVADALMDASDRGDVVVDPFLGGGATLIASEQVGRVCFGLELDPLYVDAIVRRFIRLTGHDAVREADGASFIQLQAEAFDDEHG